MRTVLAFLGIVRRLLWAPLDRVPIAVTTAQEVAALCKLAGIRRGRLPQLIGVDREIVAAVAKGHSQAQAPVILQRTRAVLRPLIRQQIERMHGGGKVLPEYSLLLGAWENDAVEMEERP